MAYRDNSHGTEPRCKELVGEIEIVEQREREYPYLKWKKKELAQELEILSEGHKAPRSERGMFLASLRDGAKLAGKIAFALLVVIVCLFALAEKLIGPKETRPGMSNVMTLN